MNTITGIIETKSSTRNFSIKTKLKINKIFLLSKFNQTFTITDCSHLSIQIDIGWMIIKNFSCFLNEHFDRYENENQITFFYHFTCPSFSHNNGQ